MQITMHIFVQLASDWLQLILKNHINTTFYA